MAMILRGIVGFFWFTATAFIAFMVYVVMQTEVNPQALWGWLVLCALTFCSATFLAYNTLFPHRAPEAGGEEGDEEEEK